jgi:hypothetical protein
VPRFIVGMVDVKRGGATAAPFMDSKRDSRYRERYGVHETILLYFKTTRGGNRGATESRLVSL